ncbi:hypothetical protein RE628_02950 [Paenibacillus sp. D2_2]|uniref:hypothetical protein n=1 Tax=Paenibacillus sp. D2_2 TaxID=3073092 RepID=UPI0028169ADD|nr:hypothetical protein [Paenibacillus sp. D2_2]WMT41517.1 hypothetical protein RE628_02950 [Paenibacillus sp. D2_2]
MLAFCQDSAVGIIDYNQVIDYIQRNAKDKERIYEFMLWSQGNPYFVHTRGLAPGYCVAILAYFQQHDKDAFKSRDYRTRYFDKAGAPLAKVFADARLTLSSPLKRFLVQNGKKVRTTTLIVTLGLVVVVGVLFILQQQGVLGKKAPVEVTPPPVQDSGVLVYAENVKGSDGTETTSLVFLFKEEQQCKIFDPSSLMIESQGQAAQQFTNLKYNSNCAVANAGTADPGATDQGSEVDGTKDTEGIDKAKGNNSGASTGENGAASGKEAEGDQGAAQSDSENKKAGGADKANATNSTNSTDGTNGTNGNSGKNGTNDATDSTNTTNGTNPADASNSNVTDPADSSDPSSNNGASKPGETAGTEGDHTKDSAYSFRIVVSLGMKLDIPTGSVIKLGEQQYTVITREEAESGGNLVNP